MPNMNPLHNRYDPINDLPSLDGKVIFVTGGTAGIGKLTVMHLAKHHPSHIYFTGRNVKQAQVLIDELKISAPTTGISFIECDFSDLRSVRAAMSEFRHSHLDILVCNAGIMATPPGLSKDGWEIQFAINHVAHALIINSLLPALSTAASKPSSDVRIVIVTSLGFQFATKSGINYSTLNTVQNSMGGPWVRYGQSKYANVLYAKTLARRYPNITSVAVHPGVTDTELIGNTRWQDRLLIYVTNLGAKYFTSEEGALNQLWLAAGMKKGDVVNGTLYLPVGVDGTHLVNAIADVDQKADELWEWTQKALKDVL